MRTRISAALALLAITTFSAGAVLAQGAPGAAGGPPAGGPPAGGAPRGGGLVPLLIESKAFDDGGIVPLKFSMYGGNTLPDFRISNAPATTQSFAIILHDLDVALGGNPDDNLHWLAWNIPVTLPVTQIEEGKLPEGSINGRGGRAYMGMGAPNGPRYHHYVFELYALSAKLDIPATAGRPELLEAMKGKVVAKAAYVGRFRNDTNAVRPPPAGGAAPGGAPPARPTGQ